MPENSLCRYSNLYETKDVTADTDTVLKSFEVQPILNPAIWNPNNTLKDDVRVDLLQVSSDFYDSLKIKTDILDIILTGSSANFNWSIFSDLDTHLIIRYADVDENLELVTEYFNAKKELWNSKYDVEIHNLPVEMYVQDVSDNLVAAGVYSLIQNAWIKEPEHIEFSVDMPEVKKKAISMMKEIDNAIDSNSLDGINKFKKKLKQYRQAGLEKSGEQSIENLVFKVLRRNGYLQKISDFKTTEYNKLHSI